MKILQLVTKRQYRGAEVFAANLSEELISLGHEVLFVGLYANDKDILSVEHAENFDLSKAKKGAFSYKVVRSLVNYIRTRRPDVVQCNGSDTLKYMITASFFLPEIPILYRNISMISEWVSSPFKKILYKNVFKGISHVSSVGKEAIEDLVNTFNYPKDKTSVIRRGIPLKRVDKERQRLALREELDLGVDAKIAIHIGNFSPEKNHYFLLDLFDQIKLESHNIKLVCVGNGILFEEVKEEINKRGLNDFIFLLGFRKDIPELLAGADCFVLCSKVEGVPGVILEAATQKVPSVSTNVGGVSEVLIDGETGYLIEDFNLNDFKQKLLHILLNERERKSFGEKAYQLVQEEYNPKKNAIKFEKQYFKLAKKEKKEHLRILQIIQKKQYRGAEVFCCQVSSHLLNLDQEVEVLSIYEGKAELPFEGKIATLNRSRGQRYWDYNGWKSLARYINDFKPDIIQANAADTLKYAVLSKKYFGWKVPIIYRNASNSSFYIKTLFGKTFNGYLLRQVDRIISVSQASKEDLNSLFPFTRFKSSVIPVGIELIPYFPKSSDLRNNTIIHIGSFTKEKNHFGLLNILERILNKHPETQLKLIGEGPLKEGVIEEVKKRGLVKNVKFLDVMSDPSKELRTAGVFVLPSLIEGLPGVILEAMYSRVPVVAYDVGGVSEVINKSTGHLIPAGEEEDFANAVINVLKYPDELIIQKAFQLTKEEFSNRNLAEKFLKTYQSVVN